MDEPINYLDKLRSDMLEQFKGKPNIEVFQEALARQLSDLYEFFDALNTLRSLQTASGVQLDGIGDIAVMSRSEALVVSKLANQTVPMEDETYRLYLAWKIALNTTNCTHGDVYRALKMFWSKSPLYYSEDPEYPATMFFSTPTLSPEDDAGVLLLAPKVKAAGVALRVLATTETPGEPHEFGIGGAVFSGVMVTKLPQYIPRQSYEEDVRVTAFRSSVEQTTLKPIT